MGVLPPNGFLGLLNLDLQVEVYESHCSTWPSIFAHWCPLLDACYFFSIRLSDLSDTKFVLVMSGQQAVALGTQLLVTT